MKNQKKKLIEVALPLEAINSAAAREKSIRHGHPATLHLWWARRPLAACRAVLFAQLVDDPSSHPEKFPTQEAVDKERIRLFNIIEELVVWENSTNEKVLNRAREAIRECCDEQLPSIYDPFSGGCSIPLEAQRLGLPAYGSDLNPIAVMIGKAMIEIPTRFKDWKPVHPEFKDRTHYRNAEGLAEDVRYYGEWVRKRAFERIGNLYPLVELPPEQGSGSAVVIAWVWARTVPSPDPAFDKIHVPMASSFLLSSKSEKEVWIEPIVSKSSKTILYRIRKGGTKEEIAQAKKGTKAGRGGNFHCLLSNAAITPEYVKTLSMNGDLDQTLIAIVAEGSGERIYLDPTAEMEEVARKAEPNWKPDQPMNRQTRDLVSGRGYGYFNWADLFTNRQLVALTTFSDLVLEARSKIERDASSSSAYVDSTPLHEGGSGAKAYAEAVSVYLTFAVDKCSDYWSSFSSWSSSRQTIRCTFGRQAIPMVWDFAETNPFSSSTGNWMAMCNWIWKVIDRVVPASLGRESQFDAQTVDYPDNSIVCTDPPYYDNIGYADLSDFFYCWMKPLLKSIYPGIFSMLATPKSEELVATSYRHGGRDAAEAFFLDGMSKVLTNMAQQVLADYPTTIYYAFKQSEIVRDGISSTGWAAFLQAVLSAGYTIVGTWPMRTEMANRMVALETNALANSIVLVCRKKETTSDAISRSEFIANLKQELPPALEELQKVNISPADMPQSAIGPGMAIFSRYQAVLEADDNPMSVKTALQLINRELDEFLGGIEGEFDANTRFAISWFEHNGLAEGDYGTANSIATARGISVDSVKDAGIVESFAGKVRILTRHELNVDWDPTANRNLTVWECCQYLIRELEHSGELATARLLRKIGSVQADAAKELAYCLHDICANKRKDAREAVSYNGLISVWSELTRLAATIEDTRDELQASIEF